MNPTDLAALVDEELALRGRDPGPLMVDVTVRACEPGHKKCRSARTRGKVDTGAGRTFLPKHLVKKLHPERHGKAHARGVVGAAHVPAYSDVELAFAGQEVRLSQALGYTGDQNYVLLGRNALAGVDLAYDGSSGKFALKPKRKRGGRGRKR